MKNKEVHILKSGHRTYKLVILGAPLPEEITEEYRNCSLFVEDKVTPPSNKQPINNMEIKFSREKSLEETIATLAFNYDEDLNKTDELKDVKSDLLTFIEKNNVITPPTTEDSGVLPEL